MNSIAALLEGEDSDGSAASSLVETAVSSQEAHDAAKSNMDFLAALAMPLIFRFAFPPVFKAVWAWLLSNVSKTREFPQLALGLPRGFGKTIVVKLFILYCILFTQKRFILIVCETQTKANNIISDVIGMLNEPNIKAIFGDWSLGVITDRQDRKNFGYRGRNIVLMGCGADTGVRGITLNNERPDVIVFDDIQSRDCADSKEQTNNLEIQIIGTLMKTKSPFGCMFLFIANMYPTPYSMLRKLKENPNWTKFIAGGILYDGNSCTSLWEELQPIKQLMREYENDLSMGHPEIFFAEVLNDETASANNLIDVSSLPPYPYSDDEIATGNFVVIDPATDKVGADAVSVGYFETHDGAIPVIKELEEGRMSPLQTIDSALKFCLKHQCRLIAVEGVAYQATLAFWFNYICNQRGITGIHCVPIYPRGGSKNSRILEMFKSLQAGHIFVHKNVHTPVFLQVTQFKPLKRDNVDGLLDLLTYAPRVIAEFPDYIASMNIIDMQEFSYSRVYSEQENSAF